jgi:glycosyltransferase involved in cell wall biosynthesis
VMNKSVVIDARMLGFAGIGTYLKSLLENIAAIENEFQFEIICREPSLLNTLPPEKFRAVPAKAKIYGAREHWEIGRLARGADLLHCPHYNIPYFYRAPLVVTIHDLTHLAHRDYLPSRAAYVYARFVMATAASRSKIIITDSQFSKKSIQERLHVPTDKIRVIYPGLPADSGRSPVSPNLSRLVEMGIKRPYVLFVGLLKPHKNVQGLIRAYARLSPVVRNGCRLVIVGKKDRSYPDLERLTREMSLERRVVFTGYVSDTDLESLYAGASLFVLPSFNEGFGLPVLEAMAYGVPVIASNQASLPEVVGKAGILVDPTDPEALANTMERVLSDEALRLELIDSGRERVKLFSARESALQHLEVYREAIRS